MLAGEENEEILGGVGRMLISDGRQGARFGRLLSFEHIAIKFHHFFTHCWVVESVLGDQIGGELLLYSIFLTRNKKTCVNVVNNVNLNHCTALGHVRYTG